MPTIGDVAVMIDAKFISMDCGLLTCLAEADINQVVPIRLATTSP